MHFFLFIYFTFTEFARVH